MSRLTIGVQSATRLSRRTVAPFSLGFVRSTAFLVCLCVLLFAQPEGQAQSTGPLKFFKNYFVTGGLRFTNPGFKFNWDTSTTTTMPISHIKSRLRFIGSRVPPG